MTISSPAAPPVPPNDDPKPPLTTEETAAANAPTVTFRVLDGAVENAVFALRTANHVLVGGAKVTLLLDKNGVQLADKTYAAGIEVDKQLQPVNVLLRQFIEKGGKVVCCGYWTKKLMLKEDKIASGVTVLPEEDFADQVFKLRSELVTLVLDNDAGWPRQLEQQPTPAPTSGTSGCRR